MAGLGGKLARAGANLLAIARYHAASRKQRAAQGQAELHRRRRRELERRFA